MKTAEVRISELDEKIKKAKQVIAEQKEKIKKYQKQMKAIKTAEDKKFINELLQATVSAGLISKKERSEILAEIRKITKMAAVSKEPKIKKSENIMTDAVEAQEQIC